MKKLFDEIPILQDDKIILKKLEVSDADALREMTQNENVYRFLPTFLVETQYEDINELLVYLYGECFDNKESLVLGIYLKEEACLCGLAEFYGYKEAIHKTCIGYRLLEKYWGRGIATKVVALMVDYLYSKAGVEIIAASTMIENGASERVLLNNDFIRTAKAVPEDWEYDEPTIADKWFR